jgi:hypothetical protein
MSHHAMLHAISRGSKDLYAKPRMAMRGAERVPYEQDFARRFRGGGR